LTEYGNQSTPSTIVCDLPDDARERSRRRRTALTICYDLRTHRFETDVRLKLVPSKIRASSVGPSTKTPTALLAPAARGFPICTDAIETLKVPEVISGSKDYPMPG